MKKYKYIGKDFSEFTVFIYQQLGLTMSRKTFADVLIVIMIPIFSLMGCASWVTPKPSENITLEKAMESVTKGLVKMEAARGEKINGLYPKQVQIEFNISAKGNTNNQLTLTDSANTSNALTLGGAAEGSRSNKIIITFSNILSDSKWIEGKSVPNLIEEMKKLNINIEGDQE